MFEGQMTGKSRRETELQWCLLGVWCVVSTAVFGGLLLVVERVGEKTAKDGVKEPPVNSSEGAVECLQGEKDFLKFLLLSLRTQVSLTVPHIHHPPLPPSPPPPPSPFLPSPPLSLSSHQHHQPCAGIFTTSLLHLLVAGLLHGVLLTLLLRCTYNKQPSKPFKFGEDLLIEEVNMSSSQKLTLLQFKIQKVSTEPLNNISITAFFCPPSTGQHKQTTNTRHSASFEACPSLLTEESPDLQEHKLHLSSDKKISSQSNFYIFPWPCVCYHQVNSASPLWSKRKTLRRLQEVDVCVRVVVKGSRGLLGGFFSQTHVFRGHHVSHLNEFTSQVVFSRPLDSLGAYAMRE